MLQKLGLIFYDEKGRARMLAPVREYARAAHPPDPADLTSAIAHCARLAAVIEHSGGGADGARVVARLQDETANIEAMLRQAADDARVDELVGGMCGLIRYWSLTGRVQQDLLADAEAAVEAHGTSWQQGRILRATGDLARARSHNDEARVRYRRALRLFRQAGDLCGAANCVIGIGDILRARYDFDSALTKYSDALLLYQRAGSVLGIANCLKSQGNVAEDQSDYDTACEKYKEALPLYLEGGSVLGAANCIKSLGDIERARDDYEGASHRYEEALRLYRQAGSVLGEANCIKGLGDIAKALSDLKGARTRYGRALRLYEKIAEPGSIGWMHVFLAQLQAPGPMRTRHWDAAREEWASIGRWISSNRPRPDTSWVEVTEAESGADGRLTVWARITLPAMCPGCGIVSEKVHQYVTVTPRDVRACGQDTDFFLVKRRMECAGKDCPAGTFTGRCRNSRRGARSPAGCWSTPA